MLRYDDIAVKSPDVPWRHSCSCVMCGVGEPQTCDARLPRSGGIPYIFKACKKKSLCGICPSIWHHSRSHVTRSHLIHSVTRTTRHRGGARAKVSRSYRPALSSQLWGHQNLENSMFSVTGKISEIKRHLLSKVLFRLFFCIAVYRSEYFSIFYLT